MADEPDCPPTKTTNDGSPAQAPLHRAAHGYVDAAEIHG